MSLYALTTEIESIVAIMLEGGVDSPEAAAALEEHLAGMDAALEQKAEGYASVITELTARAAARTQEAKRLRALADTDTALSDRLRERLKEAMERTGKTKFQTTRFAFTVAGNGGKQPLRIDPEATLPPILTRIVQEPDKDAIRAVLESGEKVPGCELLPRGTSLRIR